METRFDYRVRKALSYDVSEDGFAELLKFSNYLKEISGSASKKTHYEGLDDWNNKVFGFVRKRLDKFGFINASREQPLDAKFWWNIYGLVSNAYCSSNLRTDVARHHSSAWERNQALIEDVEQIIRNKSKLTILK